MDDREDTPVAMGAYDELASEYADGVRENPYNAELEFPATTSLLPAVEGDRVLDAGCGTGVYTEWLREHGASAVGLDASRGMLEQARSGVGAVTPLLRADLGSPLPFPDDSFDGVVSALALGYVEELGPTFAAFARLLRPGGFLVFSTAHPMDQFPPEDPDGTENYFRVERRTKQWAVEVPYYRRPLSALLNPLLEAGFSLDRILEPRPTERFRERWPERYAKESRYPVFLCVRAWLE